jgi:hypothetical protein
MGQSCGGKPWAAAATVTLAPRSREIAPRYLIPNVCHQPALWTAVGFLDTISNGLDPPISAMFNYTLSSFRTSILSDYWNGKNDAAKRAAATKS